MDYASTWSQWVEWREVCAAKAEPVILGVREYVKSSDGSKVIVCRWQLVQVKKVEKK